VLISPPAPVSDNIHTIGDFVEVDCLSRKDLTSSHEDLVQVLVKEHELDDNLLRNFANDVFAELELRQRHSGDKPPKYPFRLESQGALLRFEKESNNQHWLYLFLLFATRKNMKSDRVHAGLDGTELFEQLCAIVADRFWGGPCDEVEAEVFGTGRETANLKDTDPLPDQPKFTNRVNGLCNLIGEGEGYKAKHADPVTARDGKLDIVVVRRFADQRNGKLIGFGQCKTGTHWETDLMKLRPSEFAKKWMVEQPAVMPVRMYFVADRVRLRWYERSTDAGILFDRCRIVEYAKDLPKPLHKNLVKWTKAAMKSEKLSIR
jgi:hypothetical protein